MISTPEHDKLMRIQQRSQDLGEFLSWLSEQGYQICAWDEDTRGFSDERWIPQFKSVENWLAAFFEISLSKLEEEKHAMLTEIRNAHRS